MQPEQLTVNDVIKQLQTFADKFGGDTLLKAFRCSSSGASPNYPVVGVGIRGHGLDKPTEIILAIGVEK